MAQFTLDNYYEPYEQMKNFLIIAIIFIVTPTYLLMIFLWYFLLSPEPPQDYNSDIWVNAHLNFLIILSIGLSFLILGLTHGYLLRKFNQKFDSKTPYAHFILFFSNLVLNMFILMFGLSIILLILLNTHKLNWYCLIGFLGGGWVNLLCIYKFQTPSIYKKFSLKPTLKNALRSN